MTISRLKVEDEVLMQRSLSEFAKKSPELARKLGVVKDESDMFSRMKADGKHLYCHHSIRIGLKLISFIHCGYRKSSKAQKQRQR